MLLLAVCSSAIHAQQIWTDQQATVSFFSSTPLEDIEGVSKTATSAIDLRTGELIFKTKNTSFQFKKKLMQEHFNESYMESGRFPVSEFKGKMGNVDELQKDGIYEVPVEGKLQVHGLVKTYKTKAKITVSNGTMTATATFNVRTADHGIKIPSIVISNIAEQVAVTVSAVYKIKKP